MKYFKNIVIIIALVFAIFLGVLCGVLFSKDTKKIDTVFINEVYNNALNGVYIEGVYDYTIINDKGEVIYSTIEVENKSYEAFLTEAIKNGNVVKEMEDNRIIFYISSDKIYEEFINEIAIIVITFIACIFLFLILACIYIYYRLVYPFSKLQTFANAVAKGELDKKLEMSRYNNFGAFEEAFDIMRNNLALEREKVKEVNESKRELMAEIGHDIKTPLSSISAICECNLIKRDDIGYKTILDKAKKIESLVNDIYNATIDELDELSCNPILISSDKIYEIIEKVDYNGYVNIKSRVNTSVICDEFRLTQVLENIIINSYKYANTEIDVESKEHKDKIEIIIKDYGRGVDDRELSFVMDKFYRGERQKESNGQGLGLYISRKLLQKMGGDMACENCNGFLVRVFLPKS